MCVQLKAKFSYFVYDVRPHKNLHQYKYFVLNFEKLLKSIKTNQSSVLWDGLSSSDYFWKHFSPLSSGAA